MSSEDKRTLAKTLLIYRYYENNNIKCRYDVITENF